MKSFVAAPSKKVGLVAMVLLLGTIRGIRAEEQHNFAVDFSAGVPELLAIDLSYIGLTRWEFGLGFGSAPTQPLLAAKANLRPIPLDLGLQDSYQLVPDATFNVISFSPYARYFLGPKSNFYVQLMYSTINASGSISGDLQDTTSGKTFGGVVGGNLNFVQNLLTLSLGYRPSFWHIFFNGSLGASYLFTPTYTCDVGGSIVEFLPLLGSAGQAAFDQAKSTVKSKVDSAVQRYRSAAKFIPSINIAAGVEL